MSFSLSAMKNFALAASLLLASSAALTSCYDRDRDPMPEYSSVALVKATIDPATDTLALRPAQAAENTNPTRPEVRFTIDLYSQRDVKVTKVYVYTTLRRGTGTSISYSSRALLTEVTTFPTTLSFNSQELLTGLYRLGTPTLDTTDSVMVYPAFPFIRLPTQATAIFANDVILLTYEYELENGKRIILTPVTNRTGIITGTTGPRQNYEVITGSQIQPPYALPIIFR
jgi:hypothetical protein